MNLAQEAIKDIAKQSFDAQGRPLFDGQYRYTYTPSGQVETVSDRNDKPIARYTYNSLRQRVSKTVDATNTTAASTTYYLWQQGKLVAEIDSQGGITAQYLYLAEGVPSSTNFRTFSAA